LSLSEATSIIGSLDKLPLLHHLMRVCPLPELQFEELFVAMRSLLLKNLDKVEVSSELIYFLSTLSMHCFTNEYVYIESDEETHLIGELQAEISRTLAQSEQPEAIKILCFASFRSLHQYDWCQKLECLDNLEEVKRRLIEEPLLEKMIAKDIPVLEEISDDVSLKVREQYEENPYPRWVKLGVSIKAKLIIAVCDELKLQLYSENIKKVTAPVILIAGCGTGQHSIGTASRFSNCHVTAVDLSLASLAYAQRKSNELFFTNIDYLQADILHLHQMGKEFDIIESAGVLHHMDEPMAGWRVLVDLLKSGGLMKIGLYSELARQPIVKARKEITSLGLGASENEIRNFRELSRESEIHDVKQLSTFSDFFSLSEFRDLVFHVQEHRFTLPQIKNCLDELGLKFCGFEKKATISNFRELHGKEADIYDLALWHQYEESNPLAFASMYQFWCQKIV
jgi:SAM-dependent methyltransferase